MNLLDFGAVPDGQTLNTEVLQRAIDLCHGRGGGEVRVPAGVYLTGTILLKSHVTLHLEKDAVLLGSPDIRDYVNPDLFVDAVGQKRGWCLIGIVDLEHVGIVGEGIVNGQGACTNFTNPRPFLIRCVRSKHIHLEGVSLQDAGAWVVHLYQCKGARIRKVNIRSWTNGNNDGIDIDSTQDVVIEGCTIDTGDDAICVKATSPVATKHVLISDCVLTTRWSAFKLGTESMGDFKHITFKDSVITGARGGAIKILPVDGCGVKDITIENINATDTDMPLFMRLGVRQNTYREPEARGPGSLKDVTIRRFTCKTPTKGLLVYQTGIILTGEATDEEVYQIENVTIQDVSISLEGNGDVNRVRPIPERSLNNNYPEYCLFFPKDDPQNLWPAYGVYARHVKGVTFSNVEINTRHPDSRPCIQVEDAHDVVLDVKTNSGNGPYLLDEESRL